MTFDEVAARAIPYPPEVPRHWGTTLIVAPHPDDESLGCGGVIALMRQREQPVHVLFVSDGSMSHPNSQKYSAEARRDLREQEARQALAVLGVDSSFITFLRLPDTKVPTHLPESTAPSAPFAEATNLIQDYLRRILPQTVLVPWRRDPHGDHRATWQLLRAAVSRAEDPIHWIEYPIWVWETTNPDDLPTPDDGVWYQLNITDALT